jgi:hypothetical protein
MMALGNLSETPETEHKKNVNTGPLTTLGI